MREALWMLAIASLLLLTELGAAPKATPPSDSSSQSFTVLETLIEVSGVSGREEKVRETILGLLPAWARAQARVDRRGNLILETGRGGKRILFIAHMDEIGFEITSVERDGTARVRSLGGFFSTLYEAHPVVVHTRAGELRAIVRPRRGYLGPASAKLPFTEKDVVVDFGVMDRDEALALGVSSSDWITVPKRFRALANQMASGRSVDDRAGCTALVQALRGLDPARLSNRVTFAWSVEEETGLKGAEAIAAESSFDTVFAVDTFVSSDSPLESKVFALGILGKGPVLRAMDNSNLAPRSGLSRIQKLAEEHHLPLQIGLTHGGNDGSVFTPYGAVDLPLSWPTLYSHSAVEVIRQDDLNNLGQLVALLAEAW
jgi:putative aminopeptidase